MWKFKIQKKKKKPTHLLHAPNPLPPFFPLQPVPSLLPSLLYNPHLTAAVVVTNLQNKSKMCFMAIQLRLPSSRPQGILNIGLGLLDSTMRSMPALHRAQLLHHRVLGSDGGKNQQPPKIGHGCFFEFICRDYTSVSCVTKCFGSLLAEYAYKDIYWAIVLCACVKIACSTGH
ncbi:uncharacterized protein LOC125475674 [Pyrus x bretschneideri]|uniref:uncharacterized protein LOC125475674 n=1 Tax=Pyrus x bretschneideri TaxID=225117 RepID=UPI00202E11B8|nr:uncharacterized protein LOC125475674 [Pyrus x bretschneideri]